MVTVEQMEQILDDLEYDFHKFHLLYFIHHLERLRRRKFRVLGWPLELELSALWIPKPRTEYIIFNNTPHAIMQTHSILHEIAHMLLGHPCHPIESVLPPELLEILQLDELRGIARVTNHELRKTPMELEAEAFVLRIQQRIQAANRLKALTNPSSSIDELRHWVDGMAFTD